MRLHAPIGVGNQNTQRTVTSPCTAGLPPWILFAAVYLRYEKTGLWGSSVQNPDIGVHSLLHLCVSSPRLIGLLDATCRLWEGVCVLWPTLKPIYVVLLSVSLRACTWHVDNPKSDSSPDVHGFPSTSFFIASPPWWAPRHTSPFLCKEQLSLYCRSPCLELSVCHSILFFSSSMGFFVLEVHPPQMTLGK